MAATALSCATPRLRASAVAGGQGWGWGVVGPAFYNVRFQQQTEGKPQSPTVITRTFQPFPPEMQHGSKHKSPLFPFVSFYSLLKYFSLYHIPAASRAQTEHFPEPRERGGHRVWTPSLRGWSWKRPVLLLSASAEMLIA